MEGTGGDAERIVLVTGGGRGIGAGISRVLQQAGHRVAVGYRARADAAQAVADPRGMTVQIDIADGDSVRAAVRRVRETLGEVEVLVNNAGIAQEVPFPELTDEDWEQMLSVNLLGAVRCVRATLPAMRAVGWGRIVNVSSIGGQLGGVNQVHYAAAKAAEINFTRSIARLYSCEGITSNAIAPGLIATEMSAAELDTPAGRERLRGIPVGRLGTAEEVGEAVRFLASDGAAYVTGQTLNLNGGMLFR